MTELELLKAKDAVRQALIECAYALDSKDWARLAPLFTTDAGGGSARDGAPVGEVFHGRDELIAHFRKYLDRCGPTQHLLGNFRIEIRGGHAFSRCYVRAMHVGTGYLRTTYYDLWGLYENELVATPEGWKIRRHVERAFHEIGDRSVFALEDELA